jgi:hypothetical protein
MPQSEMVTFWAEEGFKEAVSAAAASLGLSRSAYIRMVIAVDLRERGRRLPRVMQKEVANEDREHHPNRTTPTSS